MAPPTIPFERPEFETRPSEKTDIEAGEVKEPVVADNASSIEQGAGVTKIESLYLVFGKGWKLWLLWGSIALVCYVYTLSNSTTYTYASFATSSYSEHTIIGTISVVTGIMAGVSQPFIAKMADLLSRPFALSLAVFFYTLGFILVASSRTVQAVVAGQVIYTLGTSGITQVTGILIADITSLQWRGAVIGAYSLPWVLNAFVAGYITEGISAFSNDGWRWGYGMFCILVPVCIAPSLVVLFWGHHRAKKLGALSLASSSYAREAVLKGTERRSLLENVKYYWSQIDAFGLLLIGFAFVCLLAPATLSTTAKGGYTNPSLIAMYCVGGVLAIAFMVWEFRFAAHPIMPRRVMNRTFLCCIAIDFLYYFTGYLTDTYYLSWVYIIKPGWSARDYTYFSNILTVGLCGFAVLSGLIQRYTHRYKMLQIAGLVIRVIAEGINFLAVNGNQSDAVLIVSRVLVSIGGAITVTSTLVATQGSVPHADMALAVAILNLCTQLGGSIASAISGAVWNKQVPMRLERYLGDIYNETQRAEIFGSILVARATEPHDLIVRAYTESLYGLFLAALVVCFLALVAGCLTVDFYLGKAHNTIEPHKEIVLRSKEETADEVIAARAREAEERARRQVQGAN
ncbi:uncharacterized protein COLE_04810 [Cutaneotrichosporon oleaginosum]|nr:hypothetical protein COLE_04810 [Cutaneotrichosporon oleaginosum]